MATNNTHTTDKDNWLTPRELLNALGPFDLDPCAPIRRPWDMAAQHYTILDDGLKKLWKGRVWLNPPCGNKAFKWLERLSEHKNGLALIFARTDTRGFSRFVWNKAKAVFFFKGRIAFFKVDGSKSAYANAPSCLVAYNAKNLKVIEEAQKNGYIQGKLIKLR